MPTIPYADEAPHLIEIADGVHAFVQPDGSWFINNAGLVVADGAALAIDSCASDTRTAAFIEATRRVTGRSSGPAADLLVNTHHHGDHSYGNYLFTGATIIGSNATRAGVLHAGLPNPPGSWPSYEDFTFGTVELAPPTVTFDGRITLWVGDLRCEVVEIGHPAHTRDDTFVWLPQRGVLFAGDLLFSDGTPFVLMGSIRGLIDALENRLAPLGAEVIVAGHGPVTDSSLIDRACGYLEFVWAAALAGRDRGAAPLEVARSLDLGDYASWGEAERIVPNLHRAYAELDGIVAGGPGDIDLGAAIRDMVELRGGRRITVRL